MIDPRFYRALGPVRVADLVGGADVRGDVQAEVTGLAPLDRAGAGQLCYAEKPPADPAALKGAVVFAHPSAAIAIPDIATVIEVRRPRAAFARAALSVIRPLGWHEADPPPPRIDPTAQIAPGAVIGAGAEIGAETQIGPNAVIGPGVAIGRGVRIGANASISFALIGDRVTILAGASIGESGFGVAVDGGETIDVPHFGRVIVQDGVTIGANTTIDRGVFDDTVIGEGAKIDNLCQIGHNVRVGRGVMIAAFGGISGSTELADGVRLGGRVGVADHRVIGPGATLAAGSAVMHNVPAGETWGGYPARPFRAWMRETAWVKRKAGHGDERK